MKKTPARTIERLLRERFPTVVVRDSHFYAGPHAGRFVYDVFHVPDERGHEFMEFMLRELPAILDERGIDPVALDPCGEANTRLYFPDVSPRKRRRPRSKARRRVAAGR